MRGNPNISLEKDRLKDSRNCGILGPENRSANLTDPVRVVGGEVVEENEIPWQVSETHRELFEYLYSR